MMLRVKLIFFASRENQKKQGFGACSAKEVLKFPLVEPLQPSGTLT